MRLLQVITSFSIGGAEKLLLDSIPLFIEKGVKVDILILKKDSTPFIETLSKIKNINIIFLTKKSPYNPLLIFRLIPILKKYNIVHVHLFPAIYWVAIAGLFCKKNRTKFILTEHNTHNKRRDHKILRPLERFIYKQYDNVLSISLNTKTNLLNWLIDKYLDKQKFLIVENGVLLNNFYDSKPYFKKELSGCLDEGDILLCMVGRLSKQKDQYTIIKCLEKLPSNIKLILVGDGENRMALTEFVDLNNLSDRVLFLGSRSDVPQILKTIDICILSSHWEGFGLAAVEAMASSKPIIASNVPGLAEVVNSYGLLFERGDYVHLSNLIIKLVSQKKYYEEVVDRCFERAKDFDIERMVEKQISIYRLFN